uniref:Uncharacterized protein n=1 Tax=Octopus bimaculoides TaxID=37653 RepID=A0A0L8G3F6_OCTBM
MQEFKNNLYRHTNGYSCLELNIYTQMYMDSYIHKHSKIYTHTHTNLFRFHPCIHQSIHP